jgi:hypothetical protein
MVIVRGGGGVRGILSPVYITPWNKNEKHQKLIYFTELRLNTIKNSFLLKKLISIESKYFKMQ